MSQGTWRALAAGGAGGERLRFRVGEGLRPGVRLRGTGDLDFLVFLGIVERCSLLLTQTPIEYVLRDLAPYINT
jgi:hypothetical protein